MSDATLPNRKSGFREIALLAGTSASTVDRVLNERGPVSEKSRRKVIAAATALGVQRSLPSLWAPVRRIEVVLPRNPTPFWPQLNAGLLAAAKALPSHIVMHRSFLNEGDEASWEKTILTPAFRRDALIIAPDGKGRVERALSAAAARGERVVTLTSRIPDFGADRYSGIDNFRAGRTAGLLMRNMRHLDGDILVLKATDRRYEHDDRVAGFLSTFGTANVQIFTTDERPGVTRRYLRERFALSKVAAIYSTEHNPADVMEFLQTAEDRPRWIGHDRSALHSECFERGLIDFVIDQDPEAQAHWAVRQAVAGWEDAQSVFGHARAPEARLFCQENLPG